MAKQKLDTRSIGLDVSLRLVKWLTGAENLHYGLWDGLDVHAMNVRAAQEAYTDLLFTYLPKGKLKILDIGGGAGETARKLTELGHQVDIVIPSEFLAGRCRENAPKARVFETKFEEFSTADQYDLCLFSESFQYIPMEQSLPKARDLLAPKGKILIADCFRRADFVKEDVLSQVGDGHKIDAFYDALKTDGLKINKSQDISVSVAPSVEIEQDFYNVLGHGWTRLDTEITQKRPMSARMLHGVLNMFFSKRRRARLDQRFNQYTRNRENFLKYNEYHIFLLSPQG